MNSISYAAMSAKYPPRFSDIQKVAAWCGAAAKAYAEAEANRAQERFPRTERVA